LLRGVDNLRQLLGHDVAFSVLVLPPRCVAACALSPPLFFCACDQPTNRRRWPGGGPTGVVTGGHVVRRKGLLPVPGPANGPSQTSWWLPRFRVGGRFEIAISSSPACEFESVKFLAYGNRRSNSNSASLLATERSAFSVFLIWSLLSEQSR
jgi:hypothetical protein